MMMTHLNILPGKIGGHLDMSLDMSLDISLVKTLLEVCWLEMSTVNNANPVWTIGNW
jgi:hypothetical protein